MAGWGGGSSAVPLALVFCLLSVGVLPLLYVAWVCPLSISLVCLFYFCVYFSVKSVDWVSQPLVPASALSPCVCVLPQFSLS